MAHPVVLVHGLLQGMTHLRDPEFHQVRRLEIVDLLGFGVYSATPAPGALDEQVAHLVSELDRLGIDYARVAGHSVGGAIAMLAAARHPGRVASVVSIEGNFTLADAFWSSSVAAMAPEEARSMLDGFRSAPGEWLERQRIAVTPEHVGWAKRMFNAQPASSLQALAKGVVAATGSAGYLVEISGIPGAIPIHLIAGERSRAGWAVPQSFLDRAASITIIPGVGHMMQLEAPHDLLRLVAELS